MKISEDLKARFEAAWKKLAPEQQRRVKERMREAYEVTRQHTRAAVDRTAAPAPRGEVATEGLGLAYAAFFEDPQGLQKLVGELEKRAGTEEEADEEEAPPESVDAKGEIWWPPKYMQLDPDWIGSILVWLENLNNQVPFPHGSNIITIPDDLTLALIGDWGTGPIPGEGPSPPMEIAEYIKNVLKPDYTLHLGDVYYSGTPQEERDNFLPYWPPGNQEGRTFSLNSNHEMLAGGHGYFQTLLADPMFNAQKNLSYFALENSNWILVGLDSAYHADKWGFYSPGHLDSTYQLPFLREMATKAQSSGKKVIIFTHHNGLGFNGTGTEPIWDQVMSAFPAGSQPAVWYWGHVHIGAVYPENGGVEPRCCGHGAIPWAFSSGLEKAVQDGDVTWFESTPNPDRPPQVMNGFAVLKFSGSSLGEAFFDQTGTQSWP